VSAENGGFEAEHGTRKRLAQKTGATWGLKRRRKGEEEAECERWF
jgi:hypothetical protein